MRFENTFTWDETMHADIRSPRVRPSRLDWIMLALSFLTVAWLIFAR
jgi:hypothetical protein